MALGLHNGVCVTIERATACHYCPRWVAALCLSLGVAALVFAAGCGQAPASRVDSTPRSSVPATISGTVRSSEALPVAGRTLAIVEVTTGQRRTVQTSETGAFAVALPAGTYRVELPLRDGETLMKRPDIVRLASGDVDSHVNLVLGAVRVTRPRGPAYRIENGLGSPIA